MAKGDNKLARRGAQTPALGSPVYPPVHSRPPFGPRVTSYASSGLAQRSNSAATSAASSGLLTTTPTSVFCSSERGSRLTEPMKTDVRSNPNVLPCRLAREHPATAFHPRDLMAPAGL